MKQIIQRKDRTLEEELVIKKSLGKGDFNAYFEVECGGIKRFMKTYWDSSVCAGSTSRAILRNEAKIIQENEVDSLFYGWTDIGGRLCLLFEDAGSSKSLEEILKIKTDEEGIAANAFNVYSLDQVHDILYQLLEKVQGVHQQEIVHMDISPGNVHVRSLEGRLEVKLLDLGIARKANRDLDKLYNNEQVGKISGTYYSAGKDSPVHNRLYSPPNLKKNYLQAEYSIDTYMAVNLFCLMLTGKNADYWWKRKTQEPGELTETITASVKQYVTEKGLSEDDTQALVTSLGSIITRGTNPDVSQRYQTVDDLLPELLAMGITRITREESGDPPCILPPIPARIAQYDTARETVPQQQLYQSLEDRLGQIINSVDAHLHILEERGKTSKIPDLHLASPDLADQIVKALAEEKRHRASLLKKAMYTAAGIITAIGVSVASRYIYEHFSPPDSPAPAAVSSPASSASPVSPSPEVSSTLSSPTDASSPDYSSPAAVQDSPATYTPPALASSVSPQKRASSPSRDSAPALPSLPSSPPLEPVKRRIVYSQNINGNEDIYSRDEDGSNVVQLTNTQSRDRYPALSPDGQRVAFASERSGNWEIYTVNIDGSNLVRLTNRPEIDWEPSWSPDGSRIRFYSARSRQEETQTYIINANGSDQQPVPATRSFGTHREFVDPWGN